MIIINIIGGLGNQLFEYATGKAVAMRLNVPLKIDLHPLKYISTIDTIRHLELDNYNIDYTLSTDTDLKPFFFNRKNNSFINRKFNVLYRAFHSAYLLKERLAFQYDSRIEKISSNTYLSGYFQSYKYFDSIREVLLHEFSLKEKMSDENEKLLEKIQSSNSVSIHFRRGDYVSNPHTKAHHGVCEKSFYVNAIRHITSRLENPAFFIFSDDLDYVKSCGIMDGEKAHYVEGNNGATDLFLMRNCKHNIIANSSLSWWGAWLNENKHKIIIAPKKWIINVNQFKEQNLIPPTWLSL